MHMWRLLSDRIKRPDHACAIVLSSFGRLLPPSVLDSRSAFKFFDTRYFIIRNNSLLIDTDE